VSKKPPVISVALRLADQSQIQLGLVKAVASKDPKTPRLHFDFRHPAGILLYNEGVFFDTLEQPITLEIRRTESPILRRQLTIPNREPLEIAAATLLRLPGRKLIHLDKLDALRWRISWTDSIREELTDIEAILLTPRWS